ncbi:aspartyl protease family protein [Anaerobacillus sp. MEB173]|uniref:aspartyl protease family protein n=1 Tax=Anaerobacillus sp. MEB173 TaxID=3383345 RepID=UPI003F930365
MKIEYVDYLLQTSLTIQYQGKIKVVDRMVIDTGAAHSLISSDVVDDIGIFFEPGDQLVTMVGVGGEEYSFRKELDSVELDTVKLEKIKIDFGTLDNEFGINGLIGLDILKKGEFIIDLKRLELYK